MAERIYDAPHLARNPANFTALTPLDFLARAAAVMSVGADLSLLADLAEDSLPMMPLRPGEAPVRRVAWAGLVTVYEWP